MRWVAYAWSQGRLMSRSTLLCRKRRLFYSLRFTASATKRRAYKSSIYPDIMMTDDRVVKERTNVTGRARIYLFRNTYRLLDSHPTTTVEIPSKDRKRAGVSNTNRWAVAGKITGRGYPRVLIFVIRCWWYGVLQAVWFAVVSVWVAQSSSSNLLVSFLF